MSSIDNKNKEYIEQVFHGLDLSDTPLSSIEFDGCTFKECSFSQSELYKSRFIDCHFEKCNLSNIQIKLCKFSDVSFSECKMIGIDWTHATWSSLPLPAPIKFYKCLINDSSFYGLSLNEMVLQECKAHDVDFREGSFNSSDFSYTDFSNSLFIATNLAKTDLTEAVNYNIDIQLNQIQGAKFSRYEALSLLNGLGIELVD